MILLNGNETSDVAQGRSDPAHRVASRVRVNPVEDRLIKAVAQGHVGPSLLHELARTAHMETGRYVLLEFGL